MAKKTGKKAGKSGKTDPVKRPGAEKPKATPSKKKVAIQCDFCDKPLKDENIKKIHERSCKAKSSEQPAPKQNGFESVLIELKDRFDDERQSMAKNFQDREDHIQRELEEVKTVLRLEMDRHRKELERLSKVEKEVAETHVPAPVEGALPEEKPVPAKSIPVPQMARSQQPRAIDLIPMHVPPIPKRKFPEERDPIPDLDDDSPKKSQPPALDRAAMEEMVREMVEKFRPEPVSAAELNVGQITEKLEFLDAKLEKRASELAKSIERATKEMDLKRMEKDLEKVSEKVQGVMEDSGYGESLSVSKIPPTILEIVYQAILDDIHMEIIRSKGPQDAERIASKSLEEVRLKTSGSELFKFDGRKIVTDNLAKSIEANLISAKQIQTTYDVLMERLSETVPHHKVKNFKGMIKIKSQEFAVDRATRLTRDFVRLEKNLESLNQMVAAMSANFNSQNLEIHEKLNEMEGKALAAKADKDETEALRNKLDESNERIMRLADEHALMRAEMDMKSGIKEREPIDDVFIAPGEEPNGEQPEVPEGGIFTAQQAAPEVPFEAEKQFDSILAAVTEGASSKSAIAKKAGLDAKVVVERLAEMVNSKKIIEMKAGKRVTYSTLELELRKLKEEPEPAKKPEKEKAPNKEQVHKPGVIVLDDDVSEPESVPEEPFGPSSEPTAEPAPEEPPAEQHDEPEPVPKKKKGKKKPSKKPAKAEPEPEPPAEEVPTTEPATFDNLPVVRKPLSELSEDEVRVLNAVSEDGMTLSGIQSKVGKHLKRVELLRALRVLVDSGHVGMVHKGRMELYQKITVPKIDELTEKKNKKEVK